MKEKDTIAALGGGGRYHCSGQEMAYILNIT